MEKMVKCKACGAEIAKTAKVCPHCGAKQKKHVVLWVVLAIVAIGFVASVAGGASGSPKKVEDGAGASAQSQAAAPSAAPQSEFGVGEKVELNDVTATLVSVSESDGGNYMTPADGKVFVICEFEIENNSDKEISISSMLSFEAYVDDYSTTLSLTAVTSTGKTTLDGKVDAGKKMSGILGYEVDAGWQELEIQFTPDFWSGNEIKFVYAK